MKFEFTVRRNRSSVTQGSAIVLLNGMEIMAFGDNIELTREGKPFYGEQIAGWASTTPDADFVKGVLFHPFDYIYHNSDKAKAVFEAIVKQEDAEAQEEETEALKHYFAIAKTAEGKIVIFDKYTDSLPNFTYEVEGWGHEVLSIYCEDDVAERCTL